MSNFSNYRINLMCNNEYQSYIVCSDNIVNAHTLIKEYLKGSHVIILSSFYWGESMNKQSEILNKM